jgi:hypothetical protein
MNLAQLMPLLAASQISLELNDGKLKVNAPKGAMTAELMGHLRTFKAQLLESLAADLNDDVEIVAITRPEHGKLASSFAQQRLWILDQIDQGSAHYNMVYGLNLQGELDFNALDQALIGVVERHESLRTCFNAGSDGQPYQQIQPVKDSLVEQVDLSALTDVERDIQLNELMAAQASTAFDLSADLMIRAVLIRLDANSHRLLVTMHHIASDGWSKSILIREFSTLYSAFVQGQVNPLPPLSIQYADYAHWQRQWLRGDVLTKQLNYWQQQLADLPRVHSLPLDFSRPQQQSFNGASYVSEIDLALSARLEAFCHQQGATLFMGLHGVFSTLLARLSNEHDIVLGTPVANREQGEVAELIGFFVNTLVLRADLSDQPDFVTLLAQSKHNLLAAYAHQQLPFEQVVETLQPQRSLSHSPLFQLMLVLQNNESSTLELPGLQLSGVEQDAASPSVTAKYDITLTISQHQQGLWLGWEYNRDLFGEATIAAFAGFRTRWG